METLKASEPRLSQPSASQDLAAQLADPMHFSQLSQGLSPAALLDAANGGGDGNNLSQAPASQQLVADKAPAAPAGAGSGRGTRPPPATSFRASPRSSRTAAAAIPSHRPIGRSDPAPAPPRKAGPPAI